MPENIDEISAIIDFFNDPRFLTISFEAHGPNNIRTAIKNLPQITYLIRIGNPLVDPLLEKFKKSTNDITLCCIAYVLEKLKSQKAVMPLLDYLKMHRLEMPRDWPSHFVTHTIKILTDQHDLDPVYFSYNTKERELTIKAAQDWLNKGGVEVAGRASYK